MATLTKDATATRVWFDDDNLWVLLDDGRQIGVPLAWYPRLLAATTQQRLAFEMSGNGRGLHWDGIDEDLLVQGIVDGIPDRTEKH